MRDFSCKLPDLDKTSEIIKNGGIVVYPTDTVYGIGCDPFNEGAVEKIFHLKRRPKKPLPVLCDSFASASRLVHLSKKGRELGKHFWPGALTIISPLKELRLPPALTGGKDSLAVRVPGNRCARDLINKCGGYLVGTSANISGMGAPITANQVRETITGIDVFVDGGETALKGESTVVEVLGEKVRVLRVGVLSRQELSDYL